MFAEASPSRDVAMDKNGIELMLPEYVNGSLSPEDAKRIEQMMEENMDIKSEEEFLSLMREAVKSEEVESPAEWGLARLRRTLPQPEQVEHKDTSSWWKPLAVAASFAFVLQTSYMFFNETKIDDGYVPLSTSQFENSIQVVFEVNVTEAQIRELLSSIEANIVDGPSASGVYRIVAKDKNTAIDTLKISKLISHAEVEE